MIAETIHLLAYRIHFVRQLRQRNRGNSNPECAVCDPDTTKSLRNGIRNEKKGQPIFTCSTVIIQIPRNRRERSMSPLAPLAPQSSDWECADGQKNATRGGIESEAEMTAYI